MNRRIKNITEALQTVMQKNSKSLVERFLESWFLKEERRERKIILRERLYNCEITPPFLLGDFVEFTACNGQWTGRIVDLYFLGGHDFIYTIQNAENIETGEYDTFYDIIGNSITRKVII